MSPTPLQHFEFVLFDGFSNMVLASALEPLRDVKIRSVAAPLTFRVTTMDGAPVRSSSNLAILPEAQFAPEAAQGTLVLVAGYHVRDLVDKNLLGALRRAVRNAEQIIAVDTAAWLLAAAGLLDGHRATIHWQELDAFQESFANVSVCADRFVSSGPFLSCGGASSTLDMILDLIHQRFGSAAAFDASNMFIYDPGAPERSRARSRTAQGQRVAQAGGCAQRDGRPYRTTADHFSARRAGGRVRTHPESAVPARIGHDGWEILSLFRLQTARHLAGETSLSQDQIAMRCGFSSGAALARSFQSSFGIPLSRCRSLSPPASAPP